MGSSSVRRAMSNRTANEHIKSFVAIGEEAETAVADAEPVVAVGEASVVLARRQEAGSLQS